MLATCASLIARSGFLAVATPLLLVGSVFHEVGIRLQAQSSTSLRYAVMEFTAAGQAQLMADGTLRQAVADQTMADEFGADSERQEGVAVNDEAVAHADEAEASAATENEGMEDAAEAGDAAGVAKAAQSAAGGAGEDMATDFAEAVEESAARAAAKIAAEQAAKDAAAAAAQAAIDEVAGAAAAEGAADGLGAVGAGLLAEETEAGVAATVESGGLAAPVAGAVVAGTAVAAEGPAAVAAAEKEWGAASAEIQAARDQVLAIEKQAQAEGLEASSAIYEEGSIAASRAGLASAASGVSSLAASQAFHLLALAVQAPVALIVLHQKCGTAVLALGAGGGLPAGGGHALAVGAAANALLAATLAIALGGPWARTVNAAALWEVDFFDPSPLPTLLHKAVPYFDPKKKHEARPEPESKPSQQAATQDVAPSPSPVPVQPVPAPRQPVAAVPQPAFVQKEHGSDLLGGSAPAPQRASPAPAGWFAEDSGAQQPSEAAAGAPAGWTARRLFEWEDFARDVVSSGAEGVKTLEQQAARAQEAVERTEKMVKNRTGFDTKQALERTSSAMRNGTSKLQGVLTKGSAVARDAEHEFTQTVNKSPVASAARDAEHEFTQAVNKSPVAPVVKEVEKLTDNASRAVETAGAAAGKAARNATMDMAKKVLVPKANTATTTVAPMTTAPPPNMQSSWHLFLPALASVGGALLHWAGPVIADLALISLAIVAFELTVGVGRHLPPYRNGVTGHASLVGCVLRDASSKWLQGLGFLVAIWMLSIILATSLRPYADSVASYSEGSLGAARFVVGGLCAALCVYQAHLLSGAPCPCDDASSKTVKGAASKGMTYHKLGTDEEQPEEQAQTLLRHGLGEALGEQLLREPERPGSPRSYLSSERPAGGSEQGPEPLLQPPEMPELVAPTKKRSPEDDQKKEQEQADALCLEASCAGGAIFAGALGALLAMAEAPLSSWALASSLKSFLSSKWVMSILPWGVLAEHVLPGWPHFLVSSPWPLLSAVVAVSAGFGFLLSLARRGAE